MKHLIEQEPAYILHTRPFKETSVLLEALTPSHGKVSLIAKGARGARSKTKHYLQPFLPVIISWLGRSDLHTLTQIDPVGPACQLVEAQLLSGLYLNELIVKLLRRHAAEPDIFSIYAKTLAMIQANADIESTLRQFEYQLLVSLGYGFSWHTTADTEAPIQAGTHYTFDPGYGFLSLSSLIHQQSLVFPGSHLIAISHQQLSETAVRRTAKKVMRAAINAILEGVTLRSRELFL